MKKKFGLFLPISTAVIALIGCNKQPATYKVTFDLMGGTGVSKTVVEVKEGEKVAKPEETPTKTGYTFNGWYKEPSGSEVFDFDNAVIKANTTIYAHYDINKYVVKFDTNGGTKVPDQSIEFGGTIDTSKITTPTKKGYVFKKWQKNGKDFDLGTPIVEDTTLTANYEANKHTVKFVLNPKGLKYIDIDPKSISDQTVEYGKYVTRPTDPVDKGTEIEPGKTTKYAFAGWFEDIECETKPYNFETTMGDSDLTLYAKWVNTHYVAAFYYGINPESGEEVWEYQLAKIDGEKKATVNAPTDKKIEGYHIDHWEVGGKPVTSFPCQIETHTVFDAQWAINQFTVTFDSAGGSAVKSQTIPYKGKVSKPLSPTKEHYKFKEWINEDGNPYDFDSEVYKDITLTATWTADVYTVSFDVNFPKDVGGKVTPETIESQEIEYNNFAKEPTPPVHEYQTIAFAGWYTTPNPSSTDKPFDFKNTPIVNSIKLYGHWERDSWVVCFDYGDEEHYKYVKVKNDETVAEPEKPTSTKYNFVGWYADSEFKTPFDFKNTKITQHTMVYAKWDIKTFDVQFINPQNDKVIETIKVEYGKCPTRIEDPTYEDQVFVGWYKNKDCDYKFDFNEPIINEGIKIYAGFGYEVKFECSELATTVETQKIVKNHYATFPGFPKAKDQTKNVFDWLDKNDVSFDFEKTKITSTTVLHPAFVENTIKIIGGYNIDIESGACTFTASVGSHIVDATFAVLPGFENVIKCDGESGSFTIVGAGKATISASYEYGGQKYYGTHDLEVASYRKLKKDMLENGIATAINNGVSGSVSIPSTYKTTDGQLITISEIADSAFIDCNNLQRVYIPNTIKRIGDDAFRSFERFSYAANGNLNTVVFEENSTLEYIGVAAFDGQTKLASIKIPASVTTIRAGAFYDTIKSIDFEDKDSTWHLVPTVVSVTPEVEEYNISQFTSAQIANDLKIPSYDNQSYHSDFNWYKNILK